MSTLLPIASAPDSARILRDVLGPVVAQGPILRRPRLGTLAEKLRVDDRALRRVRRLRGRYGEGPVLLRIAGRTIALVLAADDVHRLLKETPEPFAAATGLKIGALTHFQPHAVLTTNSSLRAGRRELNEDALDSHLPVHRHGHRFVDVVHEELDGLDARTLGWDDFRSVWSRVVRRIVLGDAARSDVELTEQLDQLRADANWAQLGPGHDDTRARFLATVSQYVDKAETGSLVEALDRRSETLDPAGQVPHWLFAFDAAGIALWRLLAVLGTDQSRLEPIVAEARHPEASPLLAHAGAAMQESVRLWPTTLVILRQSHEDTEWRGRIAPAGTEFVIVSSVFHRDDDALDFANRFEPAVWLDGRADGSWPIVPFSEGPAGCPGRNVVLLTTSAAVSHLADRYDLDVDPTTRAKLAGPMPGTFNHADVRIGFWRRRDS
ncbi:cytochrome P450 [Kribbella pratensis]|uniref:Cytochrome P450 n=1 Tax=Kribbella pratensis TaxID=2512112 RepID=A0ABY2F779_9ACTN|nr:cytochrome P450 [Kribbella pratensis]TDW84239.1 cytochrome P450 [Kribbella pratensis]